MDKHESFDSRLEDRNDKRIFTRGYKRNRILLFRLIDPTSYKGIISLCCGQDWIIMIEQNRCAMAGGNPTSRLIVAAQDSIPKIK